MLRLDAKALTANEDGLERSGTIKVDELAGLGLEFANRRFADSSLNLNLLWPDPMHWILSLVHLEHAG